MPIPFQPDDLLLYRTLTGVDCHPNLEIATCVVESMNPQQDTTSSTIWAVPLDGSREPWQFTSGSGSDDSPRWSPDGSQLAFLSTRNGGLQQIYLMPRDGGEAKQLTNFTLGVISMEWSPDGKQLLVTCRVQVDPNQRGARHDTQNVNRKDDDPKLVWRLPFKSDGLGYLLAREVHLFQVDASTGNSKQLTDGPFEVRSAGWSADSKQIAYTRTREGRFAHRTDVWVMEADGGNARQISEDVANTQYPKWSPDGRHIVFTGSQEEGDARQRLWRHDVEAGAVTPLGDDFVEVVSGDSVQWAQDSSQVMFVLARRGRQEVACASVPEGAVTHLVTGDRQVSKLAVTEGHVVFVSEDPLSANELYCTDRDGRGERKLTDFNSWWQDRIAPIAEVRTFNVPDGEGGREDIEGWLLRPADAAGPTPLLIDVHGGPASYVLLDHNRHMYWQVLVSRGWSILALNAVGSSSYGQTFSARLRGNWGKYDLDQQLAAIEALQQDGVTDSRIAMTGKSYGGFLTAYAISHEHLLRAAVIAAPVTNLETHYGTSDSGYYSDPYSMCGDPFLNRQTSQELSPMKHAEKARTPTLILQGEDDERCPKCQSEELFVTLMRGTDTPAEMVLYPGATHHLLESGKPSHRLDAATRLVDWVQQWIDFDYRGSWDR